MSYERIRELRDDNDLRQRDIAKFLNIAQNSYSQYETGLRDLPVAVLAKLADYYNTSIDYLIGRTNEKRSYPLAEAYQVERGLSVSKNKFPKHN